MVIKLIPRVRVNYTFKDLLQSLFVVEKSQVYRDSVLFYLKKYFNTDCIKLTGSGRGGLYHILNILPQKKVLIPAYTCSAVVEAALLAEKTILYGDTSQDDYNMHDLNEYIDNDTIVIVTHQYGLPCNIMNIIEKAKSVGSIVIEDCAASFGTKINGKLTGTFGDFSFFSLDASKLLSVPSKGGFIICNNDKLKPLMNDIKLNQPSLIFKVKHLIRGFAYCVLKNVYIYRIFHYLTMGRKNKLHIEENSLNQELNEFYKYELAEWQAKIAFRQLKNLKKLEEKRKQIYNYYSKFLSDFYIKPPVISEAVCIRYPIRVKNREDFYKKAVQKGVDFNFSFSHIVTPYSYVKEHELADTIMNLPFYYSLSEKEMVKVVNVINS